MANLETTIYYSNIVRFLCTYTRADLENSGRGYAALPKRQKNIQLIGFAFLLIHDQFSPLF